MPDFVAVLPVAHWPWADLCLATMCVELRDRVMVVDNAHHRNVGVPASWNRGISEMEAHGSDWLVLLSCAMRFGPPGGADFLAALDEHAGAAAVEAHPGFGWHCLAVSAEAIDRVGRFDLCFYPGYFEDNDWSHRFRLTYAAEAPYWTKVEVDATDAGWGHALELGGVTADPDALIELYCAKWGHRSPDELWESPYGCPALPLSFIPPDAQWRPGCWALGVPTDDHVRCYAGLHGPRLPPSPFGGPVPSAAGRTGPR